MPILIYHGVFKKDHSPLPFFIFCDVQDKLQGYFHRIIRSPASIVLLPVSVAQLLVPFPLILSSIILLFLFRFSFLLQWILILFEQDRLCILECIPQIHHHRSIPQRENPNLQGLNHLHRWFPPLLIIEIPRGVNLNRLIASCLLLGYQRAPV